LARRGAYGGWLKYYTATSNGFRIKDFDLRHTIESAQPLTFHADYNLAEGTLEYAAGDKVIRAVCLGNSKECTVRLHSNDMAFAKKEFAKRFALNDDMERIYARISTDQFVVSAIERYHGMRVTMNDPWETTLCFIMSQYNNVKRIRLIIKRFVSEFGPEILDGDGKTVGKGFPSSGDLIGRTEADFRGCGAGFRAKYIKSAADYCTNNLDLYKLHNKSYDKIKEELMRISGVGDKVADCIALMGYGKMEAFPIDVWVKRTLEGVYFDGKKKKIGDLHRFAEERWRPYAGYAQQYIFHGARNM
jgi:N-glycosylase/DNA lyase